LNEGKADLPFLLVGHKKVTMSLTENLRVLHRLSNPNLEAMNRFRPDELSETDDGKVLVSLSGRLRVAHAVFRQLFYYTKTVYERPDYVAVQATVQTHEAVYEWLATASLGHDGGSAPYLKSLAEERALDGALRMAGVGIDYPGEAQNFDWDEVRYLDDVCGI
jgi:hypothetical protein